MVKKYDLLKGEDLAEGENLGTVTAKAYELNKDRSCYSKILVITGDKEDVIKEMADFITANENDKIITDTLDLLVCNTFGSFVDRFGPGLDNLSITREEFMKELLAKQMVCEP